MIRQPVPVHIGRAEIERDIWRACLLEATARKPGNVHPAASFADLTYRDFVRSAEAIAPVLARTAALGVGRAVFEAISRTRDAVGSNTNLGIVLLLAPLAAAEFGPSPKPTPSASSTDAKGVGLKEGSRINSGFAATVRAVLERLTREDAAWVYRAIRLAQPGGMGSVPEEDIAQEPAGTLVEVMRLAAQRDMVAAQYATGFDLVLNFGVPILVRCLDFAAQWEDAVIGLHLRLMAHQPDTLIARKCGPNVARQSAERAADVLAAGWPQCAAGRAKLRELDDWLRADGHRRNPGTTADLVTACLFAALRQGVIQPPEDFDKP